MSEGVYEVLVQKWEESKLGWGTRPDGHSMHLSDADRKEFINEYWSTMPDAVQDEYSRPSGTPYIAKVDSETFEKVKKSKNGIWRIGRPPGPGGTDGWVYVNQTASA